MTTHSYTPLSDYQPYKKKRLIRNYPNSSPLLSLKPTPPLRTLHNIIGNFFKPSAVCAALGGTDNIRNYVYGNLKPSEWAPLSPSAVDLLFSELRKKVLADTTDQPDLRTFMTDRWFPKKSPPLDQDDFWHTATHTPSPPVFTAPAPPPPIIPPTVPPNFVLPYSHHILQTLTTHNVLYQLALRAIVQEYPTSVLFTNPFPL